MVNDGSFEKAIELIAKSASVLITTHTRPDGDACGCMAALFEAMTALGKKVKLLLVSSLPEWYEFLFEEKVPVLGKDVSVEQLTQGRFGDFDLIIIVDTNSLSQLPKFDRYLKHADKPVLVIDHHVTSDGLGDVELVEPDAAAAGLILHDFFKYANWPLTEKIARALFVAIATDTGWFQFSNTDSRVLRSCAELIEAGANPTQLYHHLYENFSPQRFKLMIAMLNTLELHFDGRYATQYLRLRDFERSGASYTDTENLINECQRISTVEVAALFVELKDGRIRCSLRSRGAVDVSQIAVKFGGGGHKNAAGAYLPAPLENARRLVLAEVSERLGLLDSQ
jgi:phosphoesterase RecJ-like protein